MFPALSCVSVVPAVAIVLSVLDVESQCGWSLCPIAVDIPAATNVSYISGVPAVAGAPSVVGFPTAAGVPAIAGFSTVVNIPFPPTLMSLLFLVSPDVKAVTCAAGDSAFVDVSSASVVFGVLTVDSVPVNVNVPVIAMFLLLLAILLLLRPFFFWSYIKSNVLAVKLSDYDYRTGNYFLLSDYRTIDQTIDLENYRTIDNRTKESNYRTLDYRHQEKIIK
jgi:hypothetical protein